MLAASAPAFSLAWMLVIIVICMLLCLLHEALLLFYLLFKALLKAIDERLITRTLSLTYECLQTGLDPVRLLKSFELFCRSATLNNSDLLRAPFMTAGSLAGYNLDPFSYSSSVGHLLALWCSGGDSGSSWSDSGLAIELCKLYRHSLAFLKPPCRNESIRYINLD